LLTTGGSNHLRRWSLPGGKCCSQRISSRQRSRNLQCCFGTLLRIGFQAAQNHSLNQRIEVVNHSRGTGDRAVLAQSEQIVQIAGFKRTFVSEELVEHESKRVDIALNRYFFACELFGRHVSRSSRTDLRALDISRDSSKTEVHDAHLAAIVEH